MLWIELLFAHPEQIVDDRTGKPEASVLGEAFSRALDEVRDRLLGDLDPREKSSNNPARQRLARFASDATFGEKARK